MVKTSAPAPAALEIVPAVGDATPDKLPMFGAEYEGQSVTLTGDFKAQAIRNLQTGAFGFQHLLEQVTADRPVEKSLAFSILGAHESYVAELATQFGIEVDSQKTREERFAAIRAANMRVHFLEGQLGAAVSSAHVSAGIKSFAKKLRTWWESDGFGFATDISFGAYGVLETKLCFSPTLRSGRLHQGSRSTDAAIRAEWLRVKLEQGFEFTDVPGEKGPHLSATATNQACLLKLLDEAMPSARLANITMTIEGGGDNPEELVSVFHDAKLYVRDLADVARLPDATAE